MSDIKRLKVTKQADTLSPNEKKRVSILVSSFLKALDSSLKDTSFVINGKERIYKEKGIVEIMVPVELRGDLLKAEWHEALVNTSIDTQNLKSTLGQPYWEAECTIYIKFIPGVIIDKIISMLIKVPNQ